MPERPNVVLIMTDQQSAGAMSYAGNADLNTPALDSLAGVGAGRWHIGLRHCQNHKFEWKGRSTIHNDQRKLVIPLSYNTLQTRV